MLKYGIILGVLSAIASALLFAILKKVSILIPMGCGLVSGLIMIYWFPRSQKRVPKPKEFKTIISIWHLHGYCHFFTRAISLGAYCSRYSYSRHVCFGVSRFFLVHV